MKLFEEPKMEVVMFSVEDVIATSLEEEEGGLAIEPCIS